MFATPPGRYDAWRQWARCSRCHSRKYKQTDLITDNFIDPAIEKFMQIEIHFRTNEELDPSPVMSTIERSRERKKRAPFGVYVPTTEPPTNPRREMRTPTSTPTVVQRIPTANFDITEETKLDEDLRPEQLSTGLLRVSTSMVLGLQQGIWQQIQLERQEHHIPVRPRHRPTTMILPPIPPAEASTASTASNTNGTTSVLFPCLVCPASVQIPPSHSQNAVVYCTNCATLASADLLRKTARGKHGVRSIDG